MFHQSTKLSYILTELVLLNSVASKTTLVGTDPLISKVDIIVSGLAVMQTSKTISSPLGNLLAAMKI